MASRRPDLSMDSEASEASDHEDFDYSDGESESDTRKRRPREKDSDEEELERFVLGDAENFRKNLFGDEPGKDDDEEGRKTDVFGRIVDNEEETGLENADDADFFAFDIDLGRTPANEQQLVPAPATSKAQIDPENAPAWEDSDDERIAVSLANKPRLRTTAHEDIVDGTEYVFRLRQQYSFLHPYPEWASLAEKPAKKRQRRGSAASNSSEEADQGDRFNTDALPLDKLLRDASAMKGTVSTRPRKLRPEVIDIQRSRDIPDAHQDVVTSLAFHPEYPVLLSSSTSSLLYLHHIAPTAHPIPNPLLTSTKVSQVPIRRAEFSPDGKRIYIAGRRKYMHSWNIESGVVQKTSKIHGHQDEHKSWERFKLSPCGRYLGLITTTKKGGGAINILNVHTMQWISAARLDSRGGIIDFCWWRNGNGLTILGKGGHVGEYSMATKRFLAVWNDEGSNRGSAIALGGPGGPELIGGDRWIALGSSSGVVNIYDRHKLILPSNEDELKLKTRPEPTRAIMNLITAITVLTFSPDGQILAIASLYKRDALRLVHLPSCTVYRNWPTEQTPLGRIHAVAFGTKSDMLAIGNDLGKIRVWEIRS
ncbi:hypothetical protein ONZ43_g207 [Nemania bipapillata]|uniref:Uncharacterized protein n=1 Tax=Nemania bipapillata TaxID=110536 RepID=A0ACC2J985_9PEZI|nr:hypothetical protein ONZ43_g207 [Nemania bipapillata]